MREPDPVPTMRHLPAIDGLRAVAVLAVVAYHVGLGGSGYAGVDIFFVISGYLITRLLADELRDTGRIDFIGFYARRARRILPAAVLVVVATLAVAWLIVPLGRGDIARSAAAAAVFVANFHFQAVTGGYWAESAATMPLLHLWSLSVEEQFYLLWPVVLLAARRAPARWLALVAVASLGLFVALQWIDPDAAFYQMPARAWELAAGGLVALGALRLPARIATWGLVLAVSACVVPVHHAANVIAAVAGTTAVVAAVHQGARVRILEWRPVAYVGLISYSLYLWHWPLLALDRATRVGEAPLGTRLALAALAFVLAAMSYRYVETPFRRTRARPVRVVALGLGTTLAVAGAAIALASMQPPPARTDAALVASTLRCHPWGPGVAARLQPARCVPDAPKIVLWGDSYTTPWRTWVEREAEQRGMAAVIFYGPGCPAAPGALLPRPTARASRFCVEESQQALAFLRTHRVDTLVVASQWAKMLRDQPGASANVRAGLAALPHVPRILVVGASPELLDSVPRCQALAVPCDIPRADFDAASHATRAMTAELDRLPNVEVLEVGDWLCSDTTCPGVRDGVPLYTDSHHLSPAAVDAFMRTR